MSAKRHRGAPELTCGTLWVTCDNSPTCDGTGPQKAPEGTEDMKSIDNMREYVCSAPMSSMTNMARAIVVDMTDEIEREVKELRDREYRNGMEDGEMAAERDGWVRLPVDADGEAIHVGERVQLIGNDPSTVSHMSLAGDGWRVYVKYDGDLGTGSGEPSRIRHHYAPTVEDVLREFAYGLGVPVADSYVAATAAKLQLKEG